MVGLSAPQTRAQPSWSAAVPAPTVEPVTRSSPVHLVFPAATWRATVHVLLGLLLGVVTFGVTLTLTVLAAGLGLIAVVVAPAPLLWCVRAFTTMQRSRFRALLGVRIPMAPPASTTGGFVRRILAEARSGTTWRQIGYHLLALPIGVLGFIVVAVSWSGALAGVAVLGYRAWLPVRGAFDLPMRSSPVLAVITVGGLLLLLAAPRIAIALARLDASAARALLGPSRAQEFAAQMESLARSRAGAVDAADAERRRIERDLHDGTQQRLVSLALNLGMARNELEDMPEPARQAIAKAHDEAKQALAELRDFIRGLHPAVLDDRGLDAALSGLAARVPLPVRLRVDVPERCSPTVEAVAYFVVSESLTNVAKHARASQAEVTAVRTGERLLVRVADDGVGGAALGPAPGGAAAGGGSGLYGLAQRAASVDGILRIDSPPGGPTVIEVELPCGS